MLLCEIEVADVLIVDTAGETGEDGVSTRSKEASQFESEFPLPFVNLTYICHELMALRVEYTREYMRTDLLHPCRSSWL